MKIKDFIQQDVLFSRLKQHGVLVVYDPERRYRDLCRELASGKCRVIDASESSITSRAAGLEALQKFGQPNSSIEGILVYVPAKAPRSDEEKQDDPFAIYSVCGASFPEGDGDEYFSLCLKARADYATEIRRIFNENPNPSFAVIDSVGGGAGWPTLLALLKAESASDILFALLAPSDLQKTELKNQLTWIGEAIALVQATLGLSLKTKVKSWPAIADELWRFLLFSEFVFDLPVDLPGSLGNVPCAPQEARYLVEGLCDRLRSDRRTQAVYIERAEGIQEELNLAAACQSIEDLGVRDTFPFEERSFFAQAVNALKRDNVDKLRQVRQRHKESVWAGRGENQVQWALLQAASELVQECDDAERQLSDHSRNLESLVDFYASSLREVDRYQREFEQAVGDVVGIESDTEEVAQHARAGYRKLADKVQSAFIRDLEKTGWPVAGKLSNADSFDKFVAPKLQESGRRVALFLIDALRYELGVVLSKQLSEEGQVELQPACAQLPTITPVGMASLLPGAGHNMRLVRKDDKLLVELDHQPLSTVNQRMEVLRKRYGQRFSEIDLAKFVQDKAKIDHAVELLVLRTNEMDNDFESNPEVAPSLISRTFQRIRSAIHKLAGLGFQDAIIVTDHGFFLNTCIEAGDICAKPVGEWINVHERMLLGDGTGDPSNLVMGRDALTIQGDFNQIAMPRAMVPYRAGLTYFHGGASLQEALVPIITMRIHAPEKKTKQNLDVNLTYKRGGRKITTRLPVVEISTSGQSGLFETQEIIDILLEAQDQKGRVVGEAKLGEPVNPATGIISLKPGETVQVTLKMDMEFEGKFSVKVLDPITSLELGKSLDLETDYTV